MFGTFRASSLASLPHTPEALTILHLQAPLRCHCRMGSNKFLHRVGADLKSKRLLPLKLVFFFLHGGSMVLFPFLSIYMRSLGLNEAEMALIYLSTPFISFLAPPLTGLIADRIGNFKILLSSVMIGGGLASLLFLMVPVARVKHHLPDLLPFNLTCSSPDLPPVVLLQAPYECDLNSEKTEVVFEIQNCWTCGSSSKDPSETLSMPPSSPEFSLLSKFMAPEAIQIYGYATNGTVGGTTDGNINAAITSNTFKATTEDFLSITNFTCPPLEIRITEDLPKLEMEGRKGEGEGSGGEGGGAEGDVDSWLQPCSISCLVVTNRSALCRNAQTLTEINPSRTMIISLLVRLLNGYFISTSFSLFNGAAMAIVKELEGDFGLQKLYSNLGSVILTPLSGIFIDYASKMNGFPDFRPAFYLYCGIKILCGMFILFINLEFRIPNTRVLRDCRILMKDPEVDTFLLVMIVAGMCQGYLDVFLFWFLQDLGADKTLMGLTVTVGYLAGVPLLFMSNWIIKKLGHANTIVLGLIFYVIRLLGYSFINNPWMAMPFEALESITASLAVVAASSYAGVLASPSTVATLQGLHAGVHYGAGFGLGSLIGGSLLRSLGPRKTLQIIAVISGLAGIVYFAINFIFFMNNSTKGGRVKEVKVISEAAKDAEEKESLSKESS